MIVDDGDCVFNLSDQLSVLSCGVLRVGFMFPPVVRWNQDAAALHPLRNGGRVRKAESCTIFATKASLVQLHKASC